MKLYFLTLSSFFCIALHSCKSPEARRPISQKSGELIQKSIERNKELKKKEEAYILNLIKKDSLNTYLESGNGFWYTYLKKDNVTDIKATTGDIVNFDYNIKSLAGDTIYSKKELTNQTYINGYYGDEKKIGPNVPLISEVTVNSISKID